MATRGHLGGLARATSDVALVLDAAGKDIVIIETVGVGQDEVDIVRTADVSIVVLVPGTGDDVQAIKAGIMEIADIFVVNKADREGADRAGAGGRGESVAADVRGGRVEAADPEDRGDRLASASPSCGRQIARSASTRRTTRAARQRARQRVRLRELLAQRLVQRVGAGAAGRASSSGWPSASPRASSIRTRRHATLDGAPGVADARTRRL